MQFSQLGQDITTKILLASADYRQANKISLVNRYTYASLFHFPLAEYGYQDQANIQLIRARRSLAEYGKTFTKDSLFAFIGHVIAAYSLNPKLDKLWWENLLVIIKQNINGAQSSFGQNLVAWINTQLPTASTAEAANLYFLLGMAYYSSTQKGLYWFEKSRSDSEALEKRVFWCNQTVEQCFYSALQYFEKAAEQNNLDAKAKLCELYGIEKNFTKLKVYLDAYQNKADAGDKQAAYLVAQVYHALLENEEYATSENAWQALRYYLQAGKHDLIAYYWGLKLYNEIFYSYQDIPLDELVVIATAMYRNLLSVNDPRASYLLTCLWQSGILLDSITNSLQEPRSISVDELYEDLLWYTKKDGMEVNSLSIFYNREGKKIAAASPTITRQSLKHLMLAAKQHCFAAQFMLVEMSDLNHGYINHQDPYRFNKNVYDFWKLMTVKNGYLAGQSEIASALADDDFSAIEQLEQEQTSPMYWHDVFATRWAMLNDAEINNEDRPESPQPE